MCTVLLPPGVNPIAVNKYIYIYLSICHECMKRDIFANLIIIFPTILRELSYRQVCLYLANSNTNGNCKLYVT